MVTDIYFGWQDCGYESLNDVFSDNRWVFMQSTGIKDKNGKEIFEGDVVRFSYTDDDFTWVDVVVWDSKYLGWRVYKNKDLLGYILETDDEEIEVIGNIYENPELVEGEYVGINRNIFKRWSNNC